MNQFKFLEVNTNVCKLPKSSCEDKQCGPIIFGLDPAIRVLHDSVVYACIIVLRGNMRTKCCAGQTLFLCRSHNRSIWSRYHFLSFFLFVHICVCTVSRDMGRHLNYLVIESVVCAYVRCRILMYKKINARAKHSMHMDVEDNKQRHTTAYTHSCACTHTAHSHTTSLTDHFRSSRVSLNHPPQGWDKFPIEIYQPITIKICRSYRNCQNSKTINQSLVTVFATVTSGTQG